MFCRQILLLRLEIKYGLIYGSNEILNNAYFPSKTGNICHKWHHQNSIYMVALFIFDKQVMIMAFKTILTLCMLGNFSCLCRHLLTFFKINFFK